jgi:mitotic spindle assembly checkpoint protein MAD2
MLDRSSQSDTIAKRFLPLSSSPPLTRLPTKKNSEDAAAAAAGPCPPPPEKTETDIQEEIQAIFRQITASVTFLPVLDGNCTFNVLVYADADSDVPIEWGDSDAKEIRNAEKVQLRSFSTSSHKVDTMVSYRLAD